MIKKGKHFLFGCSLVFAVGAALVAPSVKADAVDAKPEASSTTEGIKPVAAEENATYAAPAVEVAPSTPVAPATVVAEEKAVVVENTTAKTANKEALTQLVEEVKVLDKAGKTEDSLDRLNTALDQAQKVLDNAEASQEQVDAALASLKDAVAQLAAKEEKAATVATEEKTEVKEAEAAVAETEVARPRGKRAAYRSIDGSLGEGEFTGEGVKQFKSVRYSVDGDKTTWRIEVVPEKQANTFAGLAVTSDDTISSIRMIGKSGKFGDNLKDQYLPNRPQKMPFANYKVHMSEFRTIGGGIPDNIVYEVVTNGKNHNLFGRFSTALIENTLKNNGLNGHAVIGVRTSDFPSVGVSLKPKLPAETPKPQPQPQPQPQPEAPKPITPAVDAATSGPEIVNNLAGKASTPADVTVKAPAGSTVKLYNKDGVVIGEAVANDQGVATASPYKQPSRRRNYSYFDTSRWK